MKIEDAIVDLLLNHGTFYASLLSQMTRVVDKKTPTMHVEIKNGRVEMHYNPDFLDPQPMKQSKALLEHECLHIVMEHFARFKDKDTDITKVATDLAINQMINNMPSDAMTIEALWGPNANVRRNEAADYYYELINKDQKMKQKVKDMMGEGGCNGKCRPDPNGKPDPNAEPHPHSCGNDFSKDDGSSGVDQELQKEVIKQMVKEAAETARKQGHIPAGVEQYLEELFKVPEVGWRQLLRKFVANSIKAGHKASWKKPSRRYGETQKGRVSDRTVSLVVAIDTSGSIDDEMLNCFISEIRAIQSCYKSDIHMIECDAEVQKYYKLTRHGKVDRNVKGRGGTDFRPVFTFVKQKNIRCDALIFLTDLEGSFPDKKPPYPVVWGHYSYYGGKGRAPFGHVIEIKKEKKK